MPYISSGAGNTAIIPLIPLIGTIPRRIAYEAMAGFLSYFPLYFLLRPSPAGSPSQKHQSLLPPRARKSFECNVCQSRSWKSGSCARKREREKALWDSYIGIPYGDFPWS